MGGVHDDEWEIDFVSTTSTITAFLFETPVSYPNGENGEDIPLFYGWIGDPGELLAQVILGPPGSGILVDDIRAYEPVPLPAAFPLFATARAGMGLLGWRRKRKASASV